MNKGLVIALFIGASLMLAAPVMAVVLEKVPLIADGGSPDTAIVVGAVVVEYDDVTSSITVTIYVNPPWVALETHVAVATSLDGIPCNKNKNPKVGQFPYESGDLIPLADIGAEPGDTIYVAAQAVVQNPDELVPDPDNPDILVPREESAWGEGANFNEGKNWAMYFKALIPVP